jgi:hypothetical protein
MTMVFKAFQTNHPEVALNYFVTILFCDPEKRWGVVQFLIAHHADG